MKFEIRNPQSFVLGLQPSRRDGNKLVGVYCIITYQSRGRMACDEAVTFAAALISLEFGCRWYQSRHDRDEYFGDTAFDDYKNHCYVTFFLISVCSTIFYVRVLNSIALPQSLEWYIPILYLFDSAGAIGLGYSLFYENRNGVLVSMMVLTNFFLLHILHTLFSKRRGGLVSVLHAFTSKIKYTNN